MIFNERLKKSRLKGGLTQEELAKQINISPSAISLYESGEREPNLQTLVTIAKELNVTTDYLLGLSDINIASKASIEIIKDLINSITNDK